MHPPDPGSSAGLFPPTQANIAFFCSHLCKGGILGIPTETVYGLAALASDPEACRKIFELKGRPLIDPLIVHLASIEMAHAVANWNPSALKIARTFWPGPLTLILPKKETVPEIVTAGLPTVAIRLPGHPVTRKLLEQLGRPIAAPSANPFGYISPTTAQHVRDSFGDRLPWIIDGGPTPVGIESTILNCSEIPFRILRPGAISALELENAIGQEVREFESMVGQKVLAPGSLPRHYSPATPLSLFDSRPPEVPTKAITIWFSRESVPNPADPGQFWLTEDGDPSTAARSLYAVLRKADALRPEMISVQKAPHSEIGKAINDRLRRAAFRP